MNMLNNISYSYWYYYSFIAIMFLFLLGVFVLLTTNVYDDTLSGHSGVFCRILDYGMELLWIV